MDFSTASRKFTVTLALATAFAVSACGPQNTGSTYGRGEVNRAGFVDSGRIVSMREVAVEGSNTGVGTAVGAGTGAVAGSAIGRSNRANILGGIGGAVVGGVVGYGVEKAITQGKATEFVIQTDSGQSLVVVQTNEDRIQPGERVTLVTTGGKTRVQREQGRPVGEPPPPRS